MRIENIMKVKVDVNQEHVGHIHGGNKSDPVDGKNADENKIMKRRFAPFVEVEPCWTRLITGWVTIWELSRAVLLGESD